MAIQNQLKTAILLALMTAIVLWIGSFWSASGLFIAGVIVIIINLGSYFFSDKIVLSMYHAREIKPEQGHDLFRLVKEVSDLAGIPMPKVYIIPSSNMNAFATGRNPKHSAVAFTKGLLDALSKDEIKGVAAHELSHIKNRDTLISTIAGTIAGVISYAATMAQWAALFGGFGRDRDGSDIIRLLALIILAPITATIIQLAISRSREYLADESAAKMLHSPHGLIRALEKIHDSSRTNPMRFGNENTAHLFIANPFRSTFLAGLFSTHPPFEERIRNLKSYA